MNSGNKICRLLNKNTVTEFNYTDVGETCLLWGGRDSYCENWSGADQRTNTGSGIRTTCVCVCVCVCISVLAKLSQSQYSNSLFDITTQHFFPIRIKLATSLADRGVPVDDENIVNASLCSVRRICEMYIFIVRRSVKYGLPVAVTVLEEKRSNRNFRINL